MSYLFSKVYLWNSHDPAPIMRSYLKSKVLWLQRDVSVCLVRCEASFEVWYPRFSDNFIVIGHDTFRIQI